MYRIIIAICAVVFAAQASFGQGPPTYADTPIFLGLQGRGLRAFGKFVFKENATISVMPVAIPYNLRTDLLIGGVLPLVRKSLNGIDSQTGLGDASVFIKYLILQKDRAAKTFRVALKFRETFPTGNSTRPLALGLGELVPVARLHHGIDEEVGVLATVVAQAIALLDSLVEGVAVEGAHGHGEVGVGAFKGAGQGGGEEGGVPVNSSVVEADFLIPAEAMPTRIDAERPLFWELELELATPGVDYCQRYLVPVY